MRKNGVLNSAHGLALVRHNKALKQGRANARRLAWRYAQAGKEQ